MGSSQISSSGRGQQGAAEQHLLLVAAAEGTSRRAQRRRHHLQAFEHRRHPAPLFAAVDEAQPRQAAERRGAGIAQHREAGEQAVALAVLGEVDDAPGDRLHRRADAEALLADPVVDRHALFQPGEPARQPAPPAADQAAEADDLAGLEPEVERRRRAPAR